MAKGYYIGAHVSIAGGMHNAPAHAAELNATGFAVFLKNQRRWESPPYSEEDIKQFKQAMKQYGYKAEQVLVHAGYLINPGQPDYDKRKKMLHGLRDEVQRLEQLGLTMLNIHPGSHLKQVSPEECEQLIADACDTVLEEAAADTRIVLETTAGQGTNLGAEFEELVRIIDRSRFPDRFGVCIDTCHSFQAGYDLASSEGWQETMDHFGRVVGFDRLCGVHLNDAQAPLGAHKDRHAPLGDGEIGWDCFNRLVNDTRFLNVPLILETPEQERWPEEIAKLQEMSGDA